MQLAATGDDQIAKLFATPSVASEWRPDGSILVRSTVPLGPFDRSIGVWLERWAAEAPDRIFLAERADTRGAWEKISFGVGIKLNVFAIAKCRFTL